MADNNDSGDRPSGDQENSSTDTNTGSPSGVRAVINHIIHDKVEAAMWISRIVTILFSVSFLLPIFGVSQYTSGQRVLIAGAITSALRLHQRLPQIQLSREYLGLVLVEDSAHYLFYSVLMLLTTQAVSITLMPVFIFALLHVTKYTKTLLNLLGPTSMSLIRRLITKIDTNQREMLKLIATIEITLMPTSLLLILLGNAALVLPFLYYRFVCFRYTSTRNPYNRTVFYEMRLLAEHISRDSRCPAMISPMIHKCIAFVCRMAPANAPPPQQQ